MPRNPRIADGRSDSLDYLQSMLGQLRNLAESEKYDVLTYLIDMAYLEASDILRGERALGFRKQKGDSAS
jgi:hypothetical protein